VPVQSPFDRWWVDLLIGVLGLWVFTTSLRDGQTWSFARTAKRAQSPFEYWFWVTAQFVGGVAFLAVGVFRLLPSPVSDEAIGGLVLAIIGGAVVALEVRQTIRQRRISKWPIVRGHVVGSGVSMRTEADGDPAKPEYVYKPVVRYRYTLGDREYLSDMRRLGGDSWMAQPSAQRIADQYRVKEERSVYVSPSDPSMGILDPGAARGYVLSLLLAGAALIGIGATMLLPYMHRLMR